ncbi:alpha/beta fold hydrolase [Antarcticibacterium sp. 1MA-6-2]|uniref:alpha/beta fold hydrolase n=1 Tax=Antarcticibacterium sp. 1MA-6-2 TaxID=2908210 RepID=UPI001F259FDD|nr:alpha/beta fold hydrolase [Antarcticibacterium sp. 1MA-6-2]UJH89983.1 alpha/beta fold hydrolase [Antarcticibacterium sp. 1MA-6-2]
MLLEFKNTQIFFTSKGAGKPLVLLHGFLESSSIWEPYIEDLSQVRQVICIDLPGHGHSGTIGSIHSMELMADVVKAVLEHLKISKASFA